MKKQATRLMLVPILLVLALATAPAVGDQPKSEEEVALEETEMNVLQIRRQLFQARQRNDQDTIERLEKKFEKTQKERIRLLRETRQM